MPLHTRKLTLILTLVILILSLGVAIQAQDQVQLTITWWGSQNRHDRTVKVIEMFEAEHPEIDISYEFVGWADYWTKVNTQVAGGNIACIMQHDYKYMTEWASRGLLLPLDDLMESGAIDVSNVADSVIASGKVGGETVGISLGTNSQTYILDADAFEAAGVDLPAWDWTWDDFEEISNQIHDALGIWSIAYGPWDTPNLLSLFISTGQWVFNADGTALAIEDPTPLIEHLKRIKRLMDSGAIASMEEQADVTAPGLEGSPIVDGKEAIRYQWSNQMVALSTAAGEDRNLVMWTMPRVAGGESANYLKPSMFFSVTEGCETVDEAAMFIDYFTNSTEANDVLFGERGVPVSSVVREYLLEKLDPVNVQVFDFVAKVAEGASPVPPPEPVGYSDIDSNVVQPEFVDPVLFGMITPEEGYETFVAGANAILAQNK